MHNKIFLGATNSAKILFNDVACIKHDAKLTFDSRDLVSSSHAEISRTNKTVVNSWHYLRNINLLAIIPSILYHNEMLLQ